MSQLSAVRDRKFTALDSPASPFNVDYPELVESGDLLVLVVSSNASNNTFTVTGWTSLAKVDGVSGLTVEKFYRTASGGEGGSTFEVSQSSGGDIACIVRAVRGDLNPGTPEAATATADSATFDAPNLAPSGGDRLYLWTVDGGFRFGGSVINEWLDDLEQRIQQVVSGVSVNVVGSERLFEAASYNPAAMACSSTDWAAFTTAIPIDAPSVGSFPVVESTSQGSWPTGSTTQTLTLPSGVESGDVLVATIAGNFAPTVTIDGWDVLASAAEPGGTVGGTMLQRVADGTEGASVTVDLDPSRQGSYICRRISDADGTKTDVDTNSIGSDQSPGWPDLTPAGGTEDILWLTDITSQASRYLVGWPVNFGAAPLLQEDDDSNTDSVAGGALVRNTASVSPGDGALNLPEDSATFTVAIYPSASPPPPPPSGGNRMGGTGAIRKPPRTPR